MESKRLKIGLDLDGVCCDFSSGARELCNKLFDNKIPKDWIQTSWNFESLGITKEEQSLMYKVIDAHEQWWIFLKPMDGISALRDIQTKHDLYFITNRKDPIGGIGIKSQSEMWISSCLGIRYPTVIVTDDKGPVVKGLKLDAFLDDRQKNLEEVSGMSPDTKVYCFDAPYNSHLIGSYPRAVSVNDFLEKIGVV